MLTTGYALREAVKRHTLRRDIAASLWENSLKKFEGEEKEAPVTIIQRFLDSEGAIARLQTAQSEYNLRVKVHVRQLGGDIPLAYAVKLVGGIARAEKMWRGAAKPPEKDRYAVRREDVRDKDSEYAVNTVSPADAIKSALSVAELTSALRQAIAAGNAVELDIESLDASLLA